MSPTVVFIQGGWVTPACWEPFIWYFRARAGDRAPLLFVSGEADRAMTPAVVRRMYQAHRASPARTDFRSFPDRTHWLIAQDGWQEVAQGCIDWIGSLEPAESLRRVI